MEATEKIGSERILRGRSRSQAQESGGAPPERSARRFAATDVSAGQNFKGFLLALLFAGLVLLVSGALGLLIATTFYGYGGLG